MKAELKARTEGVKKRCDSPARRPLGAPPNQALHLSHEPPAYVSESDADAVLCTLLGVSKLPALSPVVISFDGRPAAKGSIFSKTKAAHRVRVARCELAWRSRISAASPARYAPRPPRQPRLLLA